MIFRRQLQSKFTAISNAICIDESISPEARWCLWYLLTKPVDWEVRVTDIRRISGWGKDKAYKVVNELVEAKYLIASQSRVDGGQFGAVSYDVYDEPFFGSPLPANPHPAEPLPVNTEHTKDLREPKTDKKQNTEVNISIDADFEEFWAAYPKRPNNPKAVAKTKYVKARSKNVSHETIVNAARKYAAMRKGEDPKYTAMAVTWLNQRRWEDDEMEQFPPETAAINDSPEFSMLCSSFPVIGNLQAASDAFEAAIRSHANIPEVIECAKKYSLLRKARGKDPAFDISLSRWLKGRLWLDMRDYEFCRTGMNNTLTVRLKKERTKT